MTAQSNESHTRRILEVFDNVNLVAIHGPDFHTATTQANDPATAEFKYLLQNKYLFTETPPDGNCGIWALLFGLEAAIPGQTGFTVQDAWNRLEKYSFSPQYAADVFEELIDVRSSRLEDYLHTACFSDLQLHLFARHLASEYNVDINLGFVVQMGVGAALHAIFYSARPSQNQQAIPVFIHQSGKHYLAFTPAPRPLTILESLLMFKPVNDFNILIWPPRHTGNHFLPKNDKLCYLLGVVNRHPKTGQIGFIPTPIKATDPNILQRPNMPTMINCNPDNVRTHLKLARKFVRTTFGNIPGVVLYGNIRNVPPATARTSVRILGQNCLSDRTYDLVMAKNWRALLVQARDDGLPDRQATSGPAPSIQHIPLAGTAPIATLPAAILTSVASPAVTTLPVAPFGPISGLPSQAAQICGSGLVAGQSRLTGEHMYEHTGTQTIISGHQDYTQPLAAQQLPAYTVQQQSIRAQVPPKQVVQSLTTGMTISHSGFSQAAAAAAQQIYTEDISNIDPVLLALGTGGQLPEDEKLFPNGSKFRSDDYKDAAAVNEANPSDPAGEKDDGDIHRDKRRKIFRCRHPTCARCCR